MHLKAALTCTLEWIREARRPGRTDAVRGLFPHGCPYRPSARRASRFADQVRDLIGMGNATVCDAPSISTTVTPTHFAAKRSTSGLMAWSAPATSAQDGLLFPAAAVAVSPKAAAASGRRAEPPRGPS